MSDEPRKALPGSGWSRESSPYHAGEKSVQERAGARDLAERVGRQVIRDFMPDQHREMFSRLPMLLLGSVDLQGRPWASVITGPPGFISSPDRTTLRLRSASQLAKSNFDIISGASIGILGIDLGTRRRNRMNGKITDVTDDGFSIRVDQSFGNCAKYIQARTPAFISAQTPRSKRAPVREHSLLSDDAVELVEGADTFFIATSFPANDGADPVEGVDVNHRGGRQGFVRVVQKDGHTVLTSPDFVGNSAFNTFGNLALNPRAGLLFIDFASGDILSLTGTANVVWESPEIADFPGAQRLLEFRVTEGSMAFDAIPLRWSPPEISPHTLRTGTWIDAET